MTNTENQSSEDIRQDAGHNTPPSNFQWIPFYEAFATALLKYKDDRKPLIAAIHEISEELDIKLPKDEFADGRKGPLEDICPFTTMAMFNKNIRDNRPKDPGQEDRPPMRTEMAGKLAAILQLSMGAPTSFDSIPMVLPIKTWFFTFANKRKEEDILILWNAFARALEYADDDKDQEKLDAFCAAFDKALEVSGTGSAYLTMGLYWIRPQKYITLDDHSRAYISEQYGDQLPSKVKSKGICRAAPEISQTF